MEKLGKQNGEAHLRVPPCIWVRKAPAPRKKRALETPAAAASGTTGDVVESEAEPAPAVTCSSACLVGLTHTSGSPPVFRDSESIPATRTSRPRRARCLHDCTLKSHTSTPPCTLNDHDVLLHLRRSVLPVVRSWCSLGCAGAGGIRKSTHAPGFELQFWYLVRGNVAGGEEGVLQIVISRHLKFDTHAASVSPGSHGDTS